MPSLRVFHHIITVISDLNITASGKTRNKLCCSKAVQFTTYRCSNPNLPKCMYFIFFPTFLGNAIRGLVKIVLNPQIILGNIEEFGSIKASLFIYLCLLFYRFWCADLSPPSLNLLLRILFFSFYYKRNCIIRKMKLMFVDFISCTVIELVYF